MKLKHLLRAVEDFLSLKERKRARERDAMKKVLRKLKKKERAMGKQVEQSQSPSKKRTLEHKCRVVRAQRRKGLRAIKALRRKH